MTASVPLRASLPQRTQVLPGRAVRAPTWQDMAGATHWALGRGAQLLPLGSPCGVALAAGTTYTFEWRTRPRYQTHARLWTITAYGSGGGADLDIEAPVGGTTLTQALGDAARTARPINYVERLGAQADSTTNLTLDLTPSGNDVIVASIGCVEIPRLALSITANDKGMDLVRLRPTEPIWAAQGGADEGLQQLLDSLDINSDIGRRVGHLAWSVPYLANTVSTDTFALSSASGTFANLFPLAIPMLARPGNLSAAGALSTTQNLAVHVHARNSAGGTSGEARVTMASGATTTINITGTSYAWFSGTIAVHAEDMTTADGRRSTTWDEATIEFRRSAGAGTVYVTGFCMNEDTP